MTPEQRLETAYPWIDWRTPLPVSGTEASGRLGCRYCIALHGLKESEIKNLPVTQDEFAAHLEKQHG